jgi:hypothetical protein
MDRIASQMVMIIEIFVAQDQAVDPLAHQLLDAMFNVTLVTVVDETAGKIPQQTAAALKLAQYQPPTIAGEVTTPKI